MSDAKRGERSYDGPSHAAPYGLSRLSPAYDLVDVAAQIQKADQSLATMTGGKLAVIAEQSIRDPLTNLFNRRKLEQELHREYQRAARYATQRSQFGLAPDERSGGNRNRVGKCSGRLKQAELGERRRGFHPLNGKFSARNPDES